jgi:peptidoglycan/LPS O-acetylase OafA/YrhL
MKKILPLQSLRAICVIVVMLVHFTPYPGAFFQNHFLAASAVFTFFALSGFIVSLVYYNKINETHDLLTFSKKRFLRMYPMHVLFLLIFLIVEIIKFYIESNYLIQSNNKAFTNNDWSAFISHLFLMNIFNNVLTFNSPTWTVSGEFITSILFGITSFFLRKDTTKFYFFLIIIVLIFLIFTIFNQKLIQYTGIYSLLSIIYSFIVGFFCFKIFFLKNKIFYLLSNNYFQICHFLIFISLIYFKKFDFFLPISSGIIIIYLCKIKNDNFFEKIFFNNFLIYTGKISYTLYITHYLVYWFYTQLFRHVLKIENINSFDNASYVFNYPIFYMTKLLLAFLTTYLISHFLYNQFEKKFI